MKKLADMGCVVDKNQVITSGMVTANYLKEHWNNPKVYLLSPPLLEEDLIARGIALTKNKPDVVVAGFDTTLTYEKLSKACSLVRNGAPFTATYLDYNCPTENGFIPDCGAICVFITAPTSFLPKYLGKPLTETLDTKLS